MPDGTVLWSDERQRQQTLQARCVHPTGVWRDFTRADTAQALGQRFAQQAAQYPERVALQTRAQVWTYAALNSMANRVAHALLAQRGPQAEPVAVLCTDSDVAIAAMLGVWKAGKFCVPLDPASPPQRLLTIVDDVQPGCVLTDNSHGALAATLVPAGCLQLDLEALPQDGDTSNPELSVSPDALAYVLYTSGSIGRPKGVMDTHRNVLHHIRQLSHRMHICAEDRHALLRSYGFGGAMRDILMALLNGSSLHILRLDLEGMPHLLPWWQHEEITICRLGVSVFRQLVSSLDGPVHLPHLRVLYIGGEPATGNDVAMFQRYFAPSCVLINGMGMTEAGTVCHYFVDHHSSSTESVLASGYPVEGMEVLVLDDTDQAVESPQTGQLVLRSRYLSPGYWRRPDLTAAVFTTTPQEPDIRLYHTGDLGYQRSDGCLVHLGRQDLQVKVRGYRVETREVEVALLGLENIRQAYVMLRQEATGTARLVAYVVPVVHPGPTTTALRRALAAVLPEYMIPTAFVMLEALPLTIHGKVDGRALPDPGTARPRLAQAYVAPRTPVETTLATLWAEVLGLEQVGVYDDFLDLGGNSLQATQIVARVLKTLQVHVPLATLFAAPTIAAMALVVTQHQAQQVDAEVLARLLAEVESMAQELRV